MMIRPRSTSVISAAALVILKSMTISVGAFSLHPIGLWSVTSQGNVKNAKVKSEGLQLKSFLGLNLDEGKIKYLGENMREASASNDDDDDYFPQSSRNQFLLDCRSYFTFGLAASTAATWSAFPATSNAKSYSENAKNLDRINNGDFSGGAVFDNNPSTERGKKRRAFVGCKTPLSREEASTTILKRDKKLSEKECNQMVLEGETEFILQALRNLDCPTCSNGIGKMN
uniref:Uncharacterized protein n=1 Tax=Pseudo-nitzschia australis TaxID=44445 RepID=A0A6U9VBM9_9STRA|mmetsp:Transcript_24647/g.52101  ORF Transcript_24647/g.52101 Transcript_24647/m.52101 type:complete len:228 (-) Transcript_24647:910-1593(-)